MTWVKWNLASVRMEIALISMRDRCMVCVECTIGSEIILDAMIVLLGGMDQAEGHFDPFGDCLNLGTS
jgi:hypothetical protein